MKKWILTALVLSSLILSGCKDNNGYQLKPSEIMYKGNTLTYNTSNVSDVFFEDGIELKVSDSNNVRYVEVSNPNVTTYGGISVGDKITKVQSKYNYEVELADICYRVVFIDNDEIDTSTMKGSDDEFHIYYYYNNDRITCICMYDNIYSNTLR